MINSLVENKNVRQRPEEGYRRWFLNKFFDVILWYKSKDSELFGFQVCYSKNRSEKAFTWEPKLVSSHFIAKRSNHAGFGNYATSILNGHAGKIPEKVLAKLMLEQGELEHDIFDFIISKIEDYNKI